VSRQALTAVSVVCALLFVTVALVCLSPEGRFRLRLFEFGVRHGAEDRHSGITYATDAPGWKVVRNSERWTSGDKLLVQRMFADPPAASRGEMSVFMAGYEWGYYALFCWTFLAGAVAAAAVFRRVRGRRLRARHE